MHAECTGRAEKVPYMSPSTPDPSQQRFYVSPAEAARVWAIRVINGQKVVLSGRTLAAARLRALDELLKRRLWCDGDGRKAFLEAYLSCLLTVGEPPVSAHARICEINRQFREPVPHEFLESVLRPITMGLRMTTRTLRSRLHLTESDLATNPIWQTKQEKDAKRAAAAHRGDQGDTFRRAAAQQRQDRVVEMRKSGVTLRVIADTEGVSERHVRRIVKKATVQGNFGA
jgi:hypothetical protein